MTNECIGIIGATGVVGKELFALLVSNGHTNLKLCASERSIGSEILNGDKSYVIEKLCESFFDNMSVAFFCSDNDISQTWGPMAINKGAIVIDNSSAFRLNIEIPLIIPEINSHLLQNKNHKLIANPNCSTVILCMSLFPLQKLNKIIRVDVSTYQAVSGAGQAGIDELNGQIKNYAKMEYIPQPKAFKSQILLNCFSHNSLIDLESGYNGEELKIIQETIKILDTPIEISATCIRVPVMRAHCESVKIVFENPVDEISIRNCLANMDGVKLLDNREENLFPEPLIASRKTDVFVGRIRRDYFDNTGKTWHMFLCGDQLLKGAAWNAFQIMNIIK